jgi:YfiH family protein
MIELLEWRPPGPYRAAFSTRRGGVSEGPYTSLNLGLKTADDPEFVLENRRRLCAEVGADPAAATLAMQVHGSRVTVAHPTSIVTPGTVYEPCDGLWSDRPGLAMMLLTADCLPVVLCRTEGDPALAVLHVGWKGLLAGIVAAGARVLGGVSLAAAVGPGIGACCYDVGEEVSAPFRAAFGDDVACEGRLDLRRAVERALRAAGIATVDHVDRCTVCEADRFFSHRRDRGVTGRQGVIAYVA